MSTIKIYSNSLKYCLLDENLIFFSSPLKIHITWPTLLDVDYYFISENVENNVGRKLAESKVGTWNAVTTSFCHYLYLKYFCLRPWYHDNFMPKKFLCVFQEAILIFGIWSIKSFEKWKVWEVEERHSWKTGEIEVRQNMRDRYY